MRQKLPNHGTTPSNEPGPPIPEITQRRGSTERRAKSTESLA
eukprot:CAMPEP_0183447776 /NCGR_PEP_ID=MMETSP0370-20130417/103810_1 /TAXON_ID=268820 /ORGANISM="Peridinium aciculiferum, Strain PAER-2" /LENGTH=41 /DNA_ID= /DNA_START= /DNA_END= /DNA_ORIENTATION=